ncbi:MAG: hypothetical protein WBH47_07435 [Streptosporangiaceae bacterium]
MTHVVLAFSHPQGPASTPGTGTYWFAFGLLVGMATVWFTPGLVKSLVLVFDLVALGWSAVILHYTDTGTGRWVLVAAAFLLIGMFIGVLNGLRHLGEAEYRTRKGSIRRSGGWV